MGTSTLVTLALWRWSATIYQATFHVRSGTPSAMTLGIDRRVRHALSPGAQSPGLGQCADLPCRRSPAKQRRRRLP